MVDLFLNEPMPARVNPVTVTGGDKVRRERWHRSMSAEYWVPKNELVSAVQAGLSSGRLKIVPRLKARPETPKEELLAGSR